MLPFPEVVYLDSSLVAINKPPGLLSLVDGYDLTKPHLRKILEPEFGKLWMVHRLDKETSGVIILAREKTSHNHINNQFSERLIEKTYHAIVRGKPEWDTITIDSPIRINAGRRKRSMVDQVRGKESLTEFRVITKFENHSLIEAKPKTGRTHQIRVHLYSIGHPVLADKLYGEGRETQIIQRLALHALSIQMIHPGTNCEILITANYYQDFIEAIKLMGK